MDKHKLRKTVAKAAAVGLAACAALIMGSGVASATIPPDPTGGATPVAPHFYNGNVEGIRSAGSDTTFFVMQKISDLYTGAGLYGCALNTGSGATLYNTTDSDTSTNVDYFCKAGANVSTTDTSDNWDRVEVTTGVDHVGSGNGQNQVCGSSTEPTPIPVDFARSSKPVVTVCSPALVPTGFAKDSAPIVESPINPTTYGTSATYPYSGINGGVVGTVANGWLPGDANTCTANNSGNYPTSGQCSGTPLTDIDNNDVSGAGSTAYRLWCASDTTRIMDWGSLTNLGPDLELQVALNGTTSATFDRQDVGGQTSSGSKTVVDPFAETSDVGLSISGPDIASGSTISTYVGPTSTHGPEFTLNNAATGTSPSGGETFTISGQTVPSIVTHGDAISGAGIPSGDTVNSVSGGTITLTNAATTTANSTVHINTGSSSLNEGQGVPIDVPIRIMGVNTSSGTEYTFSNFAESGVSSGGCSSNMNTNDAFDPNPVTLTGDNTSAHVALENNADQLNEFATTDFASPDYVDQAIEVATTLYMESNGVYNTDPYAAASTIHGTSYTEVKVSENTDDPTTGEELDNGYPTARTLYNIYNPGTIRASTGGFINWLCDSNQNFSKGLDNSSGKNFDSELNTVISSNFGFPRLSDGFTSTSGNTTVPADGLAAPNNLCAASVTVDYTSGQKTITVHGGGNFPVDILNAGQLVGGGSVTVGDSDYASGTTVQSGAGTATLTLSNAATNSSPSGGATMVFYGVPPVTSVAQPQK